MERLEQNAKSSDEPKSGVFKFPSEGMKEALTLRGTQPESKHVHDLIPKLAIFSNEKTAGNQQPEAATKQKKNSVEPELNKTPVEVKTDSAPAASDKTAAPLAAEKEGSAEKKAADGKVPEMDPEFDLKVDFNTLLNSLTIPEKFASASAGTMLVMNGRNFTIQEKFGILPGQSHEAYVNALKTTFSWTDGMLKVGKALSVPSLALAGTNIYTDSNKFMSGEHSKLLYGTALAFDGVTAGGAAAQLMSKKFLAPITCAGLLGRALIGPVEHFLNSK